MSGSNEISTTAAHINVYATFPLAGIVGLLPTPVMEAILDLTLAFQRLLCVLLLSRTNFANETGFTIRAAAAGHGCSECSLDLPSGLHSLRIMSKLPPRRAVSSRESFPST